MGCYELFTILTVMRTGAVIPAAPGEIGIADRVWTMPAARMKGERAKEDRKDFRVPLSGAALAVAEEMRHDGTDFLFPGGQCSKPLSNMAMSKLLHRMDRGDLTTQGFRSCFKDWAHECTNFRRAVIEMALVNSIDSKVEAAYRRGELFEKRRQLMEVWAQFATSLTNSAAKAKVNQTD